MAETVTSEGSGRGSRWRVAAWGFAALLLLLPAVAMQFTSEVNWTAADFIFAGVVFGLVGLTYELAVRMSRSWAYRGGVAAALAASFLILWANGAVGMIGDEDNPYNLLFYAVIWIAVVGAFISRFRPVGMSPTMALAGLAQAGIGLGGLSEDPLGAIFSTGFALPWLLAAGLFALSARDQKAADSV